MDRIAEIKQRLAEAAVGDQDIERLGETVFQLTESVPGVNRWWFSVQTQHGLMSTTEKCKLAVLFQHAPGDIAHLLERVEALEALARRMQGALHQVHSIAKSKILTVDPSDMEAPPFKDTVLSSNCATILTDAAKLLGVQHGR